MVIRPAMRADSLSHSTSATVFMRYPNRSTPLAGPALFPHGEHLQLSRYGDIAERFPRPVSAIAQRPAVGLGCTGGLTDVPSNHILARKGE